MNSSKSVLLTRVTGAALLTAWLAVQSSTLAANVLQEGVETPHPSASQPTATEPCKRYRWEHVGHPEKGYRRRVCVDQKVAPQPVAETMDHEKKCKKYVRDHYGPPGKGVDTVKVVYVECPEKR